MHAIRYIAFLSLVCGAALAGCSDGGIPRDAVPWGNYRIQCTRVKPGMYHCAVYRTQDHKLVLGKTFIDPKLSGMSGSEVISRMTRFDVGAMYLAGNRKLIACDIPEDARLAQGVGGWVWIAFNTADEKAGIYYCTVYSAKDGSVLSAGPYVLKRYGWDASARRTRYTNVNGPAPFFDFQYYGGVSITLPNRTALMPAGWIEYPDGLRSGIRVKYDGEGKTLQEEVY